MIGHFPGLSQEAFLIARGADTLSLFDHKKNSPDIVA